MKSSEGRQLAEEEHRKQIDRAKVKDPSTYLQSVPSKNLYFETSAKSGEGVDELFHFIQSTLTVELERESYGKSGRGKKGSTMDRPITLRDGNVSREGGKCCGN